jgi:hypothetical protein
LIQEQEKFETKLGSQPVLSIVNPVHTGSTTNILVLSLSLTGLLEFLPLAFTDITLVYSIIVLAFEQVYSKLSQILNIESLFQEFLINVSD